MKRFPCIRETPRSMKVYDSHNKFLAEFKPNGDKINLHDQKNDKMQYTICRKPNTPGTFELLQETLLVAEVTPSTVGSDQHVSIKAAKYGNDIVVSYKNKTDFVAKRDGAVVTTFTMTTDTTGYLDIAKGERRNFSFGFTALFVFWCEESSLPAAASGVGMSKSKSKIKSGKSEDKSKASKSGKSEEKSKEKIKKTSSKHTPDIPEKSEKSEKSEKDEKSQEQSDDTQSGKSENSDSSTNTDDITKGKKKKSTARTPRGTVISSRTSIPLRSISGSAKSPRVNSAAVVPPSSRRDQSSNSVLNALLKKNQKNPAEEDGKNES